ncbi:hypothetical protein AB0J72_56345 [Dactylosporangium sp. NPDC049742]|uniref:hypothetical protein n=1 Tax=Dactylosporangium sp. NPDC049742 TaxID=3154737 RepID=UPI00341FEEDE
MTSSPARGCSAALTSSVLLSRMAPVGTAIATRAEGMNPMPRSDTTRSTAEASRSLVAVPRTPGEKTSSSTPPTMTTSPSGPITVRYAYSAAATASARNGDTYTTQIAMATAVVSAAMSNTTARAAAPRAAAPCRPRATIGRPGPGRERCTPTAPVAKRPPYENARGAAARI